MPKAEKKLTNRVTELLNSKPFHFNQAVEEMSENTGLSKRKIWEIRTNRKLARVDEALLIADYFGQTIESIFVFSKPK